MKYFKVLALLCGGLLAHSSYAEDPDWDNFRIDDVQLRNPVNFLSSDDWNYYSRYSDKLKVKIVDYGVLNRSSGGYNYKLQKYGVEILNKNKIYQLFKTNGSYNDELWVRIDNIWLEENRYIGLTVRTNEYINYGASPYKTNKVTTYIYNLQTNKILELNSISASSLVDSKGNTTQPMDCTAGVKLTYNEKTKLFTFTDRIKKGCEGPTNEQTIKKMPVFKVNFDRNLKCVSTNDVAGECGDEEDVNDSIRSYPAEFIRMKKK